MYLTQAVHEIFFFDQYFERGVDWYARYFRQANGAKRIGDVTPTYLACHAAAGRARSVVPDALLIVQLRNPIQRAHSKYLHMWRKGDIAPGLTFREACAEAPQIIADGEFGRWIAHWQNFFPSNQFRFLVLDDARADPFAYLKNLYRILEVDDGFRAALTADRTNEHQTPRSLGLAKVAFRLSRLLHATGLHWAVDSLKALGLKRLVLKAGRDEKTDPSPLSNDDRSWLIEHYRADVERAGRYVDRDLVKLWLAPTPAKNMEESK